MSCDFTVWVPSWAGWHILPRSHAFSFSRLRTGIYFVTLVHRWNIILGDSGAISRVGRAFIAPFLPTRLTAPGSPRMSHPFNSVNFRWREATTGNTSEFAVQWVGFERLVSNQFSPGLGVFPGKSDSQSLIIISLITSNDWHYSCPRSVCCRSIVALVIV